MYYVERIFEVVWQVIQVIAALMSAGFLVFYIIRWPDDPKLWPLALVLYLTFTGRSELDDLLTELFYALSGSYKITFLVSSIFIGVTGYGLAKVMDGYGNYGWMIAAIGMWGVIVF